MAKIYRNVKFTPIKSADIERAFNRALFALKEQALKDCNYFCKYRNGDVLRSGHTEVNGMELSVIYSQSYAKYAYLYGEPSTDMNPNASLMWCERAANENGKNWEKILAKGMSDNL